MYLESSDLALDLFHTCSVYQGSFAGILLYSVVNILCFPVIVFSVSNFLSVLQMS